MRKQQPPQDPPSNSGVPGHEFDALRRHICQILGFDIALIDVVRGNAIHNLTTFYAEEPAEPFSIEHLVDANGEVLSNSDNQISQQVRRHYTPYVGTVIADEEGDEEENVGYPYIVVPIADGQGSADQVKGLIRVVSFDTNKKIEANDVSNVRLIGQHLATRMPYMGAPEPSESSEGEQPAPAPVKQTVVVAHTNRALRRRLSRTLGSDYSVIEADSTAKVLEALSNNTVSLVVLDSGLKVDSGDMLCKTLKSLDSEWKYIAILLVAPETDQDIKIQGLNYADDCVTDNYIDAELLARARVAVRLRETQQQLAAHNRELEDYAQRLEYATEVERLASLRLSNDKKNVDELNKKLEIRNREVEIRRGQDNMLRRISDTLRRSFDIDDNVYEMLDSLAGWLELDCCFIALTEECEEQDIIRKEYCTQDAYSLMQHDYDLAILDVYKEKFELEDSLIVNDVKRDKRVDCFRPVLDNYHLYSVFYVPISSQGKLLGVLGGHKCESQANWTQENQSFLEQVAVQIAMGVTNARLYKRVERQATTDGLTGLFNHRTGQEKLTEQLRVAERYQRHLAVVMMDIDHFKSINDTYGHPVGDTVLRRVAHVIKHDCRDVDIPVRYGGEEFLIILPEINQEGAVAVAERLRKLLQREIIAHDEVELSVTSSIGVAAFPDDAEAQHILLELADKALYMSKRLGRNQVHTASDLLFHDLDKSKDKAPVSNPPAALPAVPAEAALEEGETPVEDNVVQLHPHEHASPEPAAHEHPHLVHEHAHAMVPPPPPTTAAAAPSQQAESDGSEGLVPEVVEMVKAMAGALYAKSEYNKVHHLETARFSEQVAKVLGLNQRQVEQIRVAGLLHDVGLLSVPEEIINKQGQVTPDELRVLMQHPTMGAQMFRPIGALKEICDILENHHECWDGTGYPRGLKGEEIPLAARIIAIVDAYHAMISDRPYRPAMSKEKAKKVLRHGAGSQFDPFLVDIFLAVITQQEETQQAQ